MTLGLLLRRLGGWIMRTVVVRNMTIPHTAHNQVTPLIFRNACECLMSERSCVPYSVCHQPDHDWGRWDTHREHRTARKVSRGAPQRHNQRQCPVKSSWAARTRTGYYQGAPGPRRGGGAVNPLFQDGEGGSNVPGLVVRVSNSTYRGAI